MLRGTHLETCPVAARREEALQPGVSKAIPSFLRAGLSLSINTDDPAEAFANTSLADVEAVARQSGFSDADIAGAYDAACAAAFGRCAPRTTRPY